VDTLRTASSLSFDHLPRIFGAVLLLAALSLLLAIAVDAAALARALPEFQGMGRNSQLAFVLCGAALLSGDRPRLQAWLGGVVAVLALAVLYQYQFDLYPADGGWQPLLNTLSEVPWPGRMSLPTALSFLAAAAILALRPRVRGGWSLALLQGLMIVMLLPALISITGFATGATLLASTSPTPVLMSPPTATGLLLLNLVFQWQAARSTATRAYFARYPDRHILSVAAMLLLVLLLVGGLASAVLMGGTGLETRGGGNMDQLLHLRRHLAAIVLLALALAAIGALLLYRYVLPLARELRETRGNLSESLRRNQLILQNVDDGIYGLDHEGRATFVNAAAERLLGYSLDELRGVTLHTLVHHEDGSPILQGEGTLFDTLRSGTPQREVSQLFWRRDGQPREVEYASTPILEEGRVTGVVVVFRDITERQRAAAALARWQHIFEHAEWGVVVGSGDGRTLELMNPAFARMHGYSVEELSGRPIAEVFAPECRGDLMEYIRKAHELGHFLWESWHLRRDGSRFPVSIDVTAVKDADGRVLYRVVNVQDISARKEKEEALRRGESRMRMMLEHLPVGVWLADAQGGIVYGNPAGQSIWQGARYVPTDEFQVYEGWRADTGKKIAAHEWALARAIEKGETSLDEVIDIRCFDGSRKTILNSALPLLDAEGRFEGAIVINQDITAARRAEVTLREREASLAQAQSQAHLGSWRLDIVKNILEWSDETYRIFGVAPGTPMTYEIFLNHVHPDDRAFVDRKWQTSMRGEPYDIQHRVLVGDKVRWVRQRAQLEFFPDGRLRRGVGTTQDITELKHHEEELLRSRQDLRDLAAHHEKIREAERSRIAREIHDELGQYLTALRMDTAMLNIRYGADHPELAKHVAGMKETIDTTIGVVRNLAAALRPAALDMGLASAAEWLLGGFQERTGIHCQLDMPDGEELKLDEDRAIAAFRILQESLTNIARHAQASVVRVHIARRDDVLSIEVRDNGVGFDPAVVRGRKTFGLMGIRERVLMFGGESHIDSEPGAGTTLRVQIPPQGNP
jgi:PAS domain S-box-containing protein